MTISTINSVTALRFAEQARNYIMQGFCTGYYAHDAKGNNVDATDENAIAWCAMGALQKASALNTLPKFDDAWNFVAERLELKALSLVNATDLLSDDDKEYILTGNTLVKVNDHPAFNKADIVRLFDQVIKDLQNG
jgi:hypothetical protein